ncbi:MAG: hypothetical protein OXH09_13885 [Gammaproteobacteria bacterium]|nr:hypothetical protein [Gammaproteobacteria bacterium]
MPSDEPSVSLTLSIWRDFVPSRTLALRLDVHPQLLDAESGLLEEVYTWRLREDAFAGIADDQTRLDLHDRLVRALDVAKPPDERRLGVLADFVSAAEAAVTAQSVSWTPIHGLSSDDQSTPIEFNALLALTVHLKWLLACFGNRPGMSVSIR